MVRKTAKHVARNKKKYWRKISTQDIEDQLEDVRVQEMTGGLRSDQPDHILYQIDNERPLGSNEEMDTSSAPVTRSVRKRDKLDLHNLNTYKILQPHSTVPAPGSDSRQSKDPASKQMKRLIEAQNLTDKRRKATKKYQHAESQRSKAMAQNALAKVETAALDDPHVSQAYDLWNAQDEKKVKVRALVGSQLASYSEQVTNKFNWKTPKHIINKPSQLPAIERPLPGMSYNPSYDAHQDLLRQAVNVEVDKLEKEAKLQRKLATPLTQAEAAPIKQAWLKEMSSGLFDDDIEEEIAIAKDSVSVGKPVRNETKTTQQRNREKLHKKKEAQAKLAKEKRIRDNTLFRVKSIRKEVESEAKVQTDKQKQRQIEYEHHEKFGTKKFGRHKFENPDLDLNLSEELTGNLRTMKTEGNLLHDRFKSLQKRNIIEARVRAKPTKTKVKRYQKRSVRAVGENYLPK